LTGPGAGGFLSLTAPAGLRVVVAPFGRMSIYAAEGGNKMAPKGTHLASGHGQPTNR